jgi:hypothetical protein
MANQIYSVENRAQSNNWHLHHTTRSTESTEYSKREPATLEIGAWRTLVFWGQSKMFLSHIRKTYVEKSREKMSKMPHLPSIAATVASFEVEIVSHISCNEFQKSTSLHREYQVTAPTLGGPQIVSLAHHFIVSYDESRSNWETGNGKNCSLADPDLVCTSP